jgi:hypothetical protein
MLFPCEENQEGWIEPPAPYHGSLVGMSHQGRTSAGGIQGQEDQSSIPAVTML